MAEERRKSGSKAAGRVDPRSQRRPSSGRNHPRRPEIDKEKPKVRSSTPVRDEAMAEPREARRGGHPNERDGLEVKVSGVHAVHALFRVRPESIIRAYVTERRMREFSALLEACAAQRKAYHVVDDAALAKVSGTTHHEGVCVLVRRPPEWSLDALLREPRFASPGPIVVGVLEGVGNPHNVGAILRVAAFFGVAALVLVEDGRPSARKSAEEADGSAAPGRLLSPAVYRVAEGGAEFVPLVAARGVAAVLARLRSAGFAIIGTAGGARTQLFQAELPARCAFVFGSEHAGLSPKALSACDRQVAIPGSGQLESLNVATASAVAFAEYKRVHPVASQRS